MTIKLIIGLGNPGPSYEQTRHNAGAWFAQALVQKFNASFKLDKKMQAQLALIESPEYLCRIALPTTFMNLSGQPTRAISQFYQIQPEEILVIHDELDLPLGSIKLKTGGGHGGHNGLRDIISQLGSNNFHRIRIGIGHPGHRELVHSYVLTKPSSEQRQTMDKAIERGLEIIPEILIGNIHQAMNKLNS